MNCFAWSLPRDEIADADEAVISYDRCGFGSRINRFGNDEYDCISDDLSRCHEGDKAENASRVGFFVWAALARSLRGLWCTCGRDWRATNAV